MSPDRVEFVEAPVPGGGTDDVLEGDGSGGGPPGRWTLLWVGVGVVVLLGALLAGRAVTGAGPARPRASASPSGLPGRPTQDVTRPVFGLVGLPPAIGTPRDLVAATTGDVVWALDRGSGIVRVENGSVTAVQLLESQATAMAVSPDGTRLYVATAADRPSLQELDATTLRLGASRAIEGSISALAVSTDAVWAASGARLFRLDLVDLHPFATLDLPGVAVTTHLRVGIEPAAASTAVVTGVVTGSIGNGPTVTRLLRVDTGTQHVAFGAPLPSDAQVADAPLLTWVTSLVPAATPTGPRATETHGYADVLDATPSATAAPPLAPGSRIFDGGGGFEAFLVVAPDSSVIGCRDPGGFRISEVDLAPTLPGAVISGPVLRSDTAFYAVTDRGLVRTGVGACT